MILIEVLLQREIHNYCSLGLHKRGYLFLYSAPKNLGISLSKTFIAKKDFVKNASHF